MNNNKLINEKLICAFRWSVLPSVKKPVSVEKETRGDTVSPNSNNLQIFDTAPDGLLNANIVLERTWKEVIPYFKGTAPPFAYRGKQ